MAFKMKGSSFKMNNTTTNSPLQQGGVLECTECPWVEESLGEPMDSAMINAHYMSEHSSTGPGTGTPGYISPNQEWGHSWGDDLNTGGDRKAPEPKRR